MDSTTSDIELDKIIDTAEKDIVSLSRDICIKLLNGDLSVLDKEKSFAESLKIFKQYGIQRDFLTKRFSSVIDSVCEVKKALDTHNLSFDCIDEFTYEYSISFLTNMSEWSRKIDGREMTDSEIIEIDAIAYNRLADVKCVFIDPITLEIINKILSYDSLALFKSESLRFVAENSCMSLMQNDSLIEEVHKKLDILFRYIESLCRLGKTINGYSKRLIAHESPTINNFVQLVQMNKIPEEYSDWAKYIIKYKLEMGFFKEPDMSKYEEYVKNGISVPKEMKKDFLNDVSILGFIKGTIPIKYTEYLIGQMLDNESSLYRLSANQRASIFISFARERSKTIFGRDIFVLYTDNISKRNDGSYLDGSVTIAWRQIQYGGLDRVVDNLITLFHELRHVKQETDKRSGKINHKKYMMIKEDVLQELDSDYYDVNYKKIYEEIDARVSAAKEAYHFLKSLPLPKEVKEREKYVQVLERLKKVMERERSFYIRALSKKYKGDEVADIEHYFDEIIKDNPDKLEKYPILKVEYNDDGSRKSIVQIFRELCTVLKHKENRVDTYDLYRYVLFSRLYNEKELIHELMEVEIPEELSDSLKRVIQKLRCALLEKYKEISEEKKTRVLPGNKIRKDRISTYEITQIARSEEVVTSQEDIFIAGIIKPNASSRKSLLER